MKSELKGKVICKISDYGWYSPYDDQDITKNEASLLKRIKSIPSSLTNCLYTTDGNSIKKKSNNFELKTIKSLHDIK